MTERTRWPRRHRRGTGAGSLAEFGADQMLRGVPGPPCQRGRRSDVSDAEGANIPADHPKTVYLNEDKLNAALFAYLRSAIFGPERLDYWTRALNDAAGPERTAPAAERMKAAQAELADLERRLERQLLNLEADDTTPALRRRVGVRVAALRDAITERVQRIDALTAQTATEAPTLADIPPLLELLPVLAASLDAVPHRELRALFDQLNLEISYQPGEHAVDVALTLCDERGDDQTDQSPPDLRRTNPVHPAIHNANLSAALIAGETVSLTASHAKVRRNGYRRSGGVQQLS